MSLASKNSSPMASTLRTCEEEEEEEKGPLGGGATRPALGMGKKIERERERSCDVILRAGDAQVRIREGRRRCFAYGIYLLVDVGRGECEHGRGREGGRGFAYQIHGGPRCHNGPSNGRDGSLPPRGGGGVDGTLFRRKKGEKSESTSLYAKYVRRSEVVERRYAVLCYCASPRLDNGSRAGRQASCVSPCCRQDGALEARRGASRSVPT